MSENYFFLKVIKKHYENALLLHQQPLFFKEGTISLDIAKEGINKDGWKLFPAAAPKVSHLPSEDIFTMLTISQIRKKYVDENCDKKEAVPHCELFANWMESKEEVKPLVHSVAILGTTGEDFFTININPGIA